MSDERGNSLQLEAVKTEQDTLKKFIMYISYLKDLPQADPTLKDIKVEELKSENLNAFQDFVNFLKTLSADNCDNEYIEKEVGKIISNYGIDLRPTTGEDVFKNWMANKTMPFISLRAMNMGWNAKSEGGFGIKDFVEITLEAMNPDQMY